MNPRKHMNYSSEFQAMLDGFDDEDSTEESGQTSEKKRRLSINQVKALEKIFEVDNKLDPERKVKLAQELDLQPRQVAIWFQNRRARWKTKQMERDYNHLKANYESLKLNYDKLEQEKETLITELKELKSKHPKEHKESSHCDKEPMFLKPQNNFLEQSQGSPTRLCAQPQPAKSIHEVYHNINLIENTGLMDFKDRLSDSDSNVVINEDCNLHGHQLISPALSSSRFDFSSPSLFTLMNYPQFLDSRGISPRVYHQQQFMKMEDQSLYSTEESCNIYSVDEAPSLYKY
ncbi:unnamed protein product [Ilex paraguariensis]|uniref:Homeobox-leucine zipper protein n=1 Tax=Ilex paraguariensis TaxID=185542 RepID=A0ABC8RVN3_9AQUA